MTRRGILAIGAGVIAGADDWLPLFDGKSFAGWTLSDGAAVTHSWIIDNGAISTVAETRGRSDLVCGTSLRSFELTFEFRLSRDSNTGVKYLVQHALRYLYPDSSLTGSYGAIGLEFQLADDSSRDVSKPEQRMGALYGILPAEEPARYRVGDWAEARLLCRKRRCEHWINGRQVLAFDPLSDSLRTKLHVVATDPVHSIVGAAAAQVALRRTDGDLPPAFVALQQHNSQAWFRALRVRHLSE